MNIHITKPTARKLARLVPFVHFAALLVLLFFLSALPSHAGSATWNLNPTSGDWNTAVNWTPETVPDGVDDVATFGVSNTTNVALSSNYPTELGGLVFKAGASPFTFALIYPNNLFLFGAVSNQSGIVQNVVVDPFDEIGFNTVLSKAGNLMTYTALGAETAGGISASIVFFSLANAEEATLIAEGGSVRGADGAFIVFNDTSTAARSTLIANGAVQGANGGHIAFGNGSTGGAARVVVSGNGSFGIDGHYSPGVSIGSLEGNGLVTLGDNNLAVGANNLTTVFSGRISGDAGSLTKTGDGQLTLTRANAYDGGTTVNNGMLLVTNGAGSATGTAPVQVRDATLGGTGIIKGTVTIGSNSGPGAFLAPGTAGAGTLTIQKNLKLNKDATYNCELDSNTRTADKVSAKVVTINSLSEIVLSDIGTTVLTSGAVFTIINNTAATPINGAFGNLPDGSTLTVGRNTYLVSYEGGDGNDLTLTVQ